MKVEKYCLVDFMKENGAYYSTCAIKAKSLLFSHYYLLTLESSTPMISIEEVFDELETEGINIGRLSRKGKNISLGKVFLTRFKHKDLSLYGNEFHWDECSNAALSVQAKYIEEAIRPPL